MPTDYSTVFDSKALQSMPGVDPTPDPLDNMSYEKLIQKHDDWLKWNIAWENFRLLFRGGEEFLRAAGQVVSTRAISQGPLTAVDFMAQRGRRRRFLHQLEGEPETKYVSRWERASYINYFAAIINYFRHWLFSQPPSIRPAQDLGGAQAERAAAGDTDPVKAPAWWADFAMNCNGGNISFVDFMKDAFLDAMVVRRAGWLIGAPPLMDQVEPDIAGQFMSQAMAEELGLDKIVLTSYAAEEIMDWQVDAAGELLWIVLKKEGRVRMFPHERETIEIFTYVDRDRWRMWRAHTDQRGSWSGGNTRDVSGSFAKAGKRLEAIGDGYHNLGEVPFVQLVLPYDLWMANALSSWQLDLFNRYNMLKYGELLSCYPQPYLKTNDEDAESRVLGEGTILHLRSGNTATGEPPEEFGWQVPEMGPYEFVAKDMMADRDEGYRIVHQMSLAIDATVMGVANSGKSKQEDRRASEVILAAFGGYVRKAMITTLNLLSKIQGDNTKWAIDGFDNFQISSLDEELQTAALVSTLPIPSKTFKRELYKSIATGRVIGHLDELTKQAIREEIDNAIEQEAETLEDRGFGPPTPQSEHPGPEPPSPIEGVQGVEGVTGVQGVGKPDQEQEAENEAAESGEKLGPRKFPLKKGK